MNMLGSAHNKRKPMWLNIGCSKCGRIIFIPKGDIPNDINKWVFECVDCGGKYKEPECWNYGEK